MNGHVRLYYAATIIFLLLDFVMGVNLRVSFLEPFPAARILYYVFCFGIFSLMLWRPDWTLLLGAIESLISVAALTLAMAIRVMVVTDEMVDTGRGFVTIEEIINFLMVAGMSYLTWNRSIMALKATNSS